MQKKRLWLIPFVLLLFFGIFLASRPEEPGGVEDGGDRAPAVESPSQSDRERVVPTSHQRKGRTKKPKTKERGVKNKPPSAKGEPRSKKKPQTTASQGWPRWLQVLAVCGGFVVIGCCIYFGFFYESKEDQHPVNCSTCNQPITDKDPASNPSTDSTVCQKCANKSKEDLEEKKNEENKEDLKEEEKKEDLKDKNTGQLTCLSCNLVIDLNIQEVHQIDDGAGTLLHRKCWQKDQIALFKEIDKENAALNQATVEGKKGQSQNKNKGKDTCPLCKKLVTENDDKAVLDGTKYHVSCLIGSPEEKEEKKEAPQNSFTCPYCKKAITDKELMKADLGPFVPDAKDHTKIKKSLWLAHKKIANSCIFNREHINPSPPSTAPLCTAIVGGKSQYTEEATGACTINALETAVQLQLGTQPSVELVNSIVKLAALYKEDKHTDFDDIYPHVSRYNTNLKTVTVGQTLRDKTDVIMHTMVKKSKESGNKPISAVLTSPPETIFMHRTNEGQYIIFDSHPRTGLLAGHFLLFKSWKAAKMYLQVLWPYIVFEGAGFNNLYANKMNMLNFTLLQLNDHAQPSKQADTKKMGSELAVRGVGLNAIWYKSNFPEVYKAFNERKNVNQAISSIPNMGHGNADLIQKAYTIFQREKAAQR